MSAVLRAVSATGTVDENRRLHLDDDLPPLAPGRVQVIILIPDDAEPNEEEWLRAAATNPAFAFLNDAEEDVYTLADGKPFRVQG